MKEKPQITALPADKLLSTAEVAEVLGGTDVGFVNRIINCRLDIDDEDEGRLF